LHVEIQKFGNYALFHEEKTQYGWVCVGVCVGVWNKLWSYTSLLLRCECNIEAFHKFSHFS